MVELLVLIQDLQERNLLDLVMIQQCLQERKMRENFEQNEENQSQESRDLSDLLLDLLKKDFPMIGMQHERVSRQDHHKNLKVKGEREDHYLHPHQNLLLGHTNERIAGQQEHRSHDHQKEVNHNQVRGQDRPHLEQVNQKEHSVNRRQGDRL